MTYRMSTDESIHDSDNAAPQRYDPKRMYTVIKSVLTDGKISDLQCEIESGVTRGTLRNLKIGSIPSIDKIALIADYLCLSVDFILGRDDFTDRHDVHSDQQSDLSEDEKAMIAEFTEMIIRHRKRNK